MNIIQQYELKYITFDQLSEEIWGYGGTWNIETK